MPAVSLGLGQMLLARVSPLAQHHLLRPPLNAHTRCLHPGCTFYFDRELQSEHLGSKQV